MINLSEIILVMLIERKDLDIAVLSLYKLLGEDKFFTFLQDYAGHTIDLPLPSEFKKVLISYDIYKEYMILQKSCSVLSEDEQVVQRKAIIKQLSNKSNFTQEEIFDIIVEIEDIINQINKEINDKATSSKRRYK